MDLLLDLIVTLSRWSRGHLYDISLAIMATLLVLFGPGINLEDELVMRIAPQDL